LIAGWSRASEFAFIHRWHQTPQHLKVKINEAIASAMKLSEATAIKYLETEAVQIKPTNLGDIVKDWGDKYGLALSTQENWLELTGSMGITQYDLITAATETARDLENTDSREDMERMAGDLVYAELPERHLLEPVMNHRIQYHN